ncbi:MAG: hypothetical protein Q4G69_02155 [Planctomycetia bacterium]|nr:hypothetical protein [Planctomycetia bacterium]
MSWNDPFIAPSGAIDAGVHSPRGSLILPVDKRIPIPVQVRP